jgi:hypothetical protein
MWLALEIHHHASRSSCAVVLGVTTSPAEMSQKLAEAPRNGSVHEIDHGPVSPVQEPGELSEIWRGHVVVHGVKIAVIGDI